MSTLEEERNEFKKWYKLERVQKTGAWTEDDERQMRLEMQKIENHASTLALVITGVEVAVVIAILFFVLHLLGVM